MQHFRHRALLATLPFLLAAPYGYAQPVQPPTQAEAQAALNPAPAAFTNAQLDQMLAPIALYQDQLLTQVLMGATFPLQLIDAGKWLQDGNNAALKGDDLATALEPLPWDPSVKSLVAFPQLITMMTEHLDWTETLGAAFANQEVATFARVQFLRERAMKAGALKSTTQLAVRQEASDIIIEPADPNMIYVPVYNPAEVYGTWLDSDAPPVYIPPPRGFYDGALGAGIGFSVGFGVVAPLWGWGHPDWQRHEVVVDPGRYQRITRQPDITRNHINLQGEVWSRTAPIVLVPQAQRPRAPQQSGERPAGTIRPSEVARPGRPGGGEPGARPGESTRPGQPSGQPTQPGGALPSPGSRQGEQPHGAQPSQPGGALPSPGPRQGEQPHGGQPSQPSGGALPSQEPRQGEQPHGGPPPQSGESPRRGPGEEPHGGAQPGSAPANPGERPHGGQPPQPGPHPGEPPHPGQPPEPGQPPRGGAQPAQPTPPPHPSEAQPAPHPAPPAPEPPHPAPAPSGRAPTPPPEAHPAPPQPQPPHPAQQPPAQAQHPPGPPPQGAHPGGPPPGEKKPPPKPGEEDKPEGQR